ncbi:MAG: hypothetical protein K8S55_15230 [Phycisphaerae bacterium]|nr:hypothetical protein [Phycisphaerae bacterium]
MEERKWTGFAESSEEDMSPQIEVGQSSSPLVTREMRDAGEHTVLTIRYHVGGIWEGTVQDFTTVDIPDTSHIDEEGAPAVPKDGIFVAIPEDARDVEIRTVDKLVHQIPKDVNLAPAPKQFREEEFKEVYEPDARIYDNDEPYPGKDFEFLGLKSMEGINVAHLLVYLGQYQPKSKQLEVVQSMTLEVSFSTPPQMDRKPGRKPRETITSDLILGLDLLDKSRDYASHVEDLSDLEEVDITVLEEESGESALIGMSHLERLEEDFTDPTISPIPIERPLFEELLRPKLKVKSIIAEYVIITTKALASSVEPLRSAKAGWPYYARVALTEDISREFPSSSLKESILEFLKWTYKNWRVPPRFLILAGDTDVLPIHLYNRSGVKYASDHYYADLKGDLVPEISVSRIPTSDTSTLKRVCQYIANYGYYRGGDWGGWQNRVMLCAYQANTYESTCDQVANKIKCRFHVIKRYAKNTNKNDVINTMRNGVLFAVYRGHGGKTSWSSSNGLNTNDVRGLGNYGRPPFVLNICCQNGWVDDNSMETITETFIRQRKSVSAFAASRDSWTYPNNDFIKYVFDAVMTGRSHDPSEIIRYAKTKMVRNHPTSSYHLDNVVMYNLFGDATANVASNVEYLRGEWDMNHDGWRGVLKISRIYRYRVERYGNSCGPVWDISGKYVAHNNKSYPFIGTIGAFDEYHVGSTKKRSDHKVEFHIRFSNSNNQHFVGYVYTWDRRRMSGLTWWSGRPFGWNATRR